MRVRLGKQVRYQPRQRTGRRFHLRNCNVFRTTLDPPDIGAVTALPPPPYLMLVARSARRATRTPVIAAAAASPAWSSADNTVMCGLDC